MKVKGLHYYSLEGLGILLLSGIDNEFVGLLLMHVLLKSKFKLDLTGRDEKSYFVSELSQSSCQLPILVL